ncbi:MAG: helix-turn-helix transcriptional regulator [Hyphomicrobiales bacterium]|jgi:transcriptional regulator with XRE-family HTH domain|nr:helix-turn-helix transcriptional regulator [Hyphomicrobiales bacterium]
MVKKQPHPIDLHVGRRVKMRRMLIGMSQEKLGNQLGLTFQQVQKYEKGANRIGASRLWDISRILEVPVRFFFEGLRPETGPPAEGFAEEAQPDYVLDFVQSSEGVQLIKAFVQIKDDNVRRGIVNLAKTLAKDR